MGWDFPRQTCAVERRERAVRRSLRGLHRPRLEQQGGIEAANLDAVAAERLHDPLIGRSHKARNIGSRIPTLPGVCDHVPQRPLRWARAQHQGEVARTPAGEDAEALGETCKAVMEPPAASRARPPSP